MSATRATLEAALAADPDDEALHAAYADLLTEDGDPRGEYIRALLVLEDRSQLPDRLASAFETVRTLEREFRDDWLGPLAHFLGRPSGRTRLQLRFRRGWVEDAAVSFLTPDLADAFMASPVTRLVRDFSVSGVTDDFTTVELERLLRFLAATPLDQLDLSWPGFGNDGLAVLLRVGLPPRLTVLGLPWCGIDRAAAEALARCPGITRLETVRVHGNPLGRAGVEVLTARLGSRLEL